MKQALEAFHPTGNLQEDLVHFYEITTPYHYGAGPQAVSSLKEGRVTPEHELAALEDFLSTMESQSRAVNRENMIADDIYYYTDLVPLETFVVDKIRSAAGH